MRIEGVVAALRGLTVLVDDLPLPVGSLVGIGTSWRGGASDDAEARATMGEVVGFNREHAIVMLLGQTTGIRAGDRVIGLQSAQTAPVGERLLGRVVDGLGRPIDGLGPIHDTVAFPIHPEPLSPLRRRRITQAMHTGVRAVDLMTTLGRGQRIGVFAGPGVGKSTLLGTIAKRASSDVNVIALIGERGREVGDFLAHALGPEGLARSVVVVATSDESPLLRVRAALLACTAAEFFRDRGRDVMLMMDSVTRFAHAQRQIGLSVGEPPATKGFTPSVFSAMALLLERAGAVKGEGVQASSGRDARGADRVPSQGGSITGLYTILVEGDDMTEPIADAARGILDGHIILARKLAQKGHYPAIDVLDSVSRVADDVCDKAHNDSRRQIVRMMAVYRDVEDLVQIGAYAPGSNPEADVAIDYRRAVLDLLQQGRGEVEPFEQSRSRMVKIALDSGDALNRRLRVPARAAAAAGVR
jgi:flagellum-specific ATP synthase